MPGNTSASVQGPSAGIDASHKVSSRFVTQTGRVTKYDKETNRFKIRPHMAPYGDIECPALISSPGIDAPYGVGDTVALHRYPAIGWVIVGKIPLPRNRLARPERGDEKARGQEVNEVSYRNPADKERQFYAEDGEFRFGSGDTQGIMSRAGTIAFKVAHDCVRFFSKSGRLIRDTCYRYVLSIPRMIFEAKTDPETGEPSAKARIRPQNETNEIKARLGGKVTDAGEDGMQVTMGELFRFAISLLPGDTQLELIQNTTTIRMTATEFLLQFGDGTFTFNDTSLQVVKGETTVTLDASSLAIVTQTLTLTLSTLTVEASGAVTINGQAVIAQNYYFLTVVQRLNNLLLNFSTHVHTSDVPGAPTSVPTGNPVNEKGTPIGTPIATQEPPLSV